MKSEAISTHRTRGIVCCFCGEAWGYATEKPSESLIAEAVAHEAKCEKNPYLPKIAQLRAALSRIQDFPVHSEPLGCAYAMQDIAANALEHP